ncbi:MAG: YybH family protein [Candidatus Cyclobacteriaceae bacterium M2_1C_046]
MKYIFLVCCTFFVTTVQGQSADELEIKKQLYNFQKAHNNSNLDSMMMVVSKKYRETFFPDIAYDAAGIRDYYRSLIENPAYNAMINYSVEDVEVMEDTGITEVNWDYLIFPSNSTDTLYYSENKGMIQWQKENNKWVMRKAYGGNVLEMNKLNSHSTKQAIETQMLDWSAYFNNKDLEGLMGLYDDQVKGLSTFNGKYLTSSDLLQKYKNLFNNENLQVSYKLEGLEELTFADDLAYTLTVWEYKVYDRKQDISNKTIQRNLTIWQQQEKGDWKIVSFVRKEIE